MAESIRDKRVQKMKEAWGETRVQKKKKKEAEEKEKEKSTDVSKFAEIVGKKPGEC